MSRIIKGSADNIINHVINRGNGRQEVFHGDAVLAGVKNIVMTKSEEGSRQ